MYHLYLQLFLTNLTVEYLFFSKNVIARGKNSKFAVINLTGHGHYLLIGHYFFQIIFSGFN